MQSLTSRPGPRRCGSNFFLGEQKAAALQGGLYCSHRLVSSLRCGAMVDRMDELRGECSDIEMGEPSRGFMAAFFEEVNGVKSALCTMAASVARIEALQSESLTATSAEEGKAAAKQLQEESGGMNVLAKKVRAQLKAMDAAKTSSPSLRTARRGGVSSQRSTSLVGEQALREEEPRGERGAHPHKHARDAQPQVRRVDGGVPGGAGEVQIQAPRADGAAVQDGRALRHTGVISANLGSARRISSHRMVQPSISQEEIDAARRRRRAGDCPRSREIGRDCP